MPREEETGRGDLTHYRLDRLEEEQKAHAEHCEINRGKIWDAIDSKAEKVEVGEMRKKLDEMIVSVAKSNVRLAMIAAGASAVFCALLSYGLRHLP